MYGSDCDGMAAVTAGTNSLGQAVIADLNIAVLIKDIAGFEVTMYYPAIMQMGKTFCDFAQEEVQITGKAVTRLYGFDGWFAALVAAMAVGVLVLYKLRA